MENKATYEHNIDTQAVFSRIQAAMKVQGIKGVDISSALGLSGSAFSSWKVGKTTSYIKHIDSIADYMGMPADFLLYGSESMDAGEVFSSLTQRGISCKSVAEMLRLSPSCVYNWRNKNAIPTRHMDGIISILNTEKPLQGKSAFAAEAKDGILTGLKQRGIRKSSLAKSLGISKATVYSWKDDQSIPDKYVEAILGLMDDGDEDASNAGKTIYIAPNTDTGNEETATINDRLAVFVRDMCDFLECELAGLNGDEQNNCLEQLGLAMRLSTKQARLLVKAASALR